MISHSILLRASGAPLARLTPRSIFLPVCHDFEDALHILRLVIGLVANLRVGKCPVVPQRLQGSRADS